jgi:glycosyltransferase involved in cell wall biosynthesis
LNDTQYPCVLQVCTADGGGGAELSAWNLHHGLRARGVTSWLAVGRKTRDDDTVFLIPNERSRNAWVRTWRGMQLRSSSRRLVNRAVNAVNTAIGAVASVGEPRRLLDVRWRGREDFDFPGTGSLLDLPPRRPDILHCHNLHGGYFDLRELPRLSRLVPTVIDLRDEWLLTGHCAYTLGCERWSSGCGDCPDLQRYVPIVRDASDLNWQEKRRIFSSSRVYLSTPSHWLLDRALRVIEDPALARVIWNGIESETFFPGSRAEARTNLGLPEAAPVVLTSAHTGFKDVETVCTAVRSIDLNWHGDPAPLLLVLGMDAGPPTIGSWQARYLGFVADRQEMADLYRSADVFVHAALGEVFGKTIAEAMACGTPTVATEVGGIPEIFGDDAGILVPPKDPDALARALESLLRETSRRIDIGRKAARRAHDKFTLERQTDRWMDYYDAVLDDWRSSGGRPSMSS